MYQNMPEQDLRARIGELQNIQKRNTMDGEAWQEASALLRPMFSE